MSLGALTGRTRLLTLQTTALPWLLLSLGTLSFGGSCRTVPESTPVPHFSALVRDFSEPGGYFDTDNLISNETSYTQVVERLKPTGGVYVGVGPEQNFTYIGRMRPRWAFILDIRRENMLQHLLFNAIFHKATTPYQYLCWMFSRPLQDGAVPAGEAEIEAVVSAFEKQAPHRGLHEDNLKELLRHIEGPLGMELTIEDKAVIRSVYGSFFREQLEIRFNSHGRRPMPYHPTYGRLLLGRSPSGRPSHFLASYEDYTYVRDLVVQGRVVPVVGDFAGPHALRSIGRFLEEQGERVSALYVSNVEFYLLRSGRFDSYVENVRALPLQNDSLFIRAYFDYGLSHPARLPGHRSTVLLQRVPRFLALYDTQAYRSYWDVCTVDYMR